LTYLWETLLRADEQAFPREMLRFIPAINPSPYKEVAHNEINRNHVSDEPIEINAFYRFGLIFENVVNGLDDYPELKATFFDILMHFLAEVNTYEGLSRREYYGRFLYDDVRSGKYGAQYKTVMQTFERKQVRYVTESMVRLYEAGSSVELIKTLLRKVYPRSITYFNVGERRELLVYIGKKETTELKLQVNFILSLFVPIDYVCHLFWDKHFGIIGVDATMELGEFVTY